MKAKIIKRMMIAALTVSLALTPSIGVFASGDLQMKTAVPIRVQRKDRRKSSALLTEIWELTWMKTAALRLLEALQRFLPQAQWQG